MEERALFQQSLEKMLDDRLSLHSDSLNTETPLNVVQKDSSYASDNYGQDEVMSSENSTEHQGTFLLDSIVENRAWLSGMLLGSLMTLLLTQR